MPTTIRRRHDAPVAGSDPRRPHLHHCRDAAPLDARARCDALLARIHRRTATVGVVGLGYVGLPLAVEQAKAGFRVIGIDNCIDRVKKVNCGENYIGDIKDEELSDVVNRGYLEAAADFSLAPELDIVILAIPTPLTRNLQPDLSQVIQATRALANDLRP